MIGTRPEAIKMCPLIIALKEINNSQCVVCITGQHREMLQQVMNVFRVEVDYDLKIMQESQTLSYITGAVLNHVERIIEIEKPDIVLVHGDTTTAMAAAMASFYNKTLIGHVEAGLRTGNKYFPFPEEINRVFIDRIADYYFVPTLLNKKQLEKEGVKKNIYITGNTVIDSFKYTVRKNYVFKNLRLNDLDYSKKIVLITAHRRENLGIPLENVCNAIKTLALEKTEIVFIYPVHLNPLVKKTVYKILDGIENVLLLDPLDVLDMHNLESRCYLVLTDSGGLQEEAPYFGKPVLVLRNETERPEAVNAGTVRIIGTKYEDVVNDTRVLLENCARYNEMANATSPYGDGNASSRIVQVLSKSLKVNVKSYAYDN